MIIYIPYYLNWLHKEIETSNFPQTNSIAFYNLKQQRTFSPKMYILSLGENVVCFPPGSSSLQVVSIISAQVFPAVFFVASLEIQSDVRCLW